MCRHLHWWYKRNWGPNCCHRRIHLSYASPWVLRREKKSASLQTVLKEAWRWRLLLSVKLALWVYTFFIFWVTKWEATESTSALYPRTAAFLGKSSGALVQVMNWTSHFFTRNVKWLTNYVFFCLRHLSDIFSKVNEGSLSFPGKQLTVFCYQW